MAMGNRMRLVGLVAAVGLLSADLFACGDKFLVSARGTRYQRPKSARAASILIYADPSSGLPAVGGVPVESVLKRQGHRSTTAETLQQLSALLAGGRYDVILAAGTVAAAVEGLLTAGPDAPVVVAVKAPLKERPLLEAIDKAIERHDHNARRIQARS